MGAASGGGWEALPALQRAAAGWSGHNASREGGKADGSGDNSKNTPVTLLPVTIARGIFSYCGISS